MALLRSAESLQVDDAFGEIVQQLQFDIESPECSRFSAAEHSLHFFIEHQKAQLTSLREQELTMAVTSPAQHEPSHLGDFADVGVQLLDDAADTAAVHMSPVAFAKQLCDAATLNRDQLRPVALIARELERAWQAERQRRGTCHDSAVRSPVSFPDFWERRLRQDALDHQGVGTTVQAILWPSRSRDNSLLQQGGSLGSREDWPCSSEASWREVLGYAALADSERPGVSGFGGRLGAGGGACQGRIFTAELLAGARAGCSCYVRSLPCARS